MSKFEYTPTRFMLPSSRYSRDLADHAVAFINQLCHTKGEWAGKPFELFNWQEQIVRDIFGIVDRETGYRQFRHVFVEMPKKQGKSELAAALALYLLCADAEEGAEIYGCANDRKQAGIVFEVARDMVMMNPALAKMCKIKDSEKRILFKPTRSFYAAMSAEVATKYGLNVHGCIFDELLGQKDRQLYDIMTSGSGAARRQPLNFVITTAGRDRTSICWDIHCKALDIIEGRKIDRTFYPVVYTAPDDCQWDDEEVWKSVCPSLGKTVSLEFMKNQCESAKQDSAEEMNFRQFFLCQWVYSPKRWLPMDKYDKGATPFKAEDLAGRECYGGLDLASTSDIAAFVLVFPPIEGDEHYYILPYFWIPANNVEQRVKKHHVKYDKWIRDGFLYATVGDIIYYDFIEKEIQRLSEIYNIREIAFDEWGAHQMVQNLERSGFVPIKYRQGFFSLSRPSKEFYRFVLDEKIRHGGHPVLRWMFNNVYIETDAADNIKPSKKKSEEKIDGAIGAIMALDLAIRGAKKQRGGITVYDPTTDTIIRNGKVVEEPDRKTETWEERTRRLEWESLKNL